VSPPASIAEIASSAGIRRVHMVAWRDLDDPEAGGSELHAHEVARRWSEGGLDVTLRTSVVVGAPKRITRDGYRVVRKTGRYLVFARSAVSGFLGRDGARDAVVEIWNGMPFFSPLWARAPRIVFLHHVHDEMWDMVIRPKALARAGRAIEFRAAPPLYRSIPIVTLSESSKREIVELLGLPERNITVVPPGIDPRFSPGDADDKSPHPLVVAVGRLVPVKRFHLLIDALARLKSRHPALEAVIVGEGYERTMLEHRVKERGGHGWIHLPGRLEDDELIALYRKAWVLASSSAREGWGMTITEAAACGTPAVVTRIGGHEDAVIGDETGLLVDDVDGLVRGLDLVLGDEGERSRLTKGALDRASQLTWEATARRTFEVLADEAARWHGRHGRHAHHGRQRRG
jgi:glycosyltransferase involved in cell wall biosynthesis